MIVIGIILSIVLSYLLYWLGAKNLFLMFSNSSDKTESIKRWVIQVIHLLLFGFFWIGGFIVIYIVTNTALGRFPFTLHFIFTFRMLCVMAIGVILLGIGRYRLKKTDDGSNKGDVIVYCASSAFVILVALLCYH